jgi:hypothetical protein
MKTLAILFASLALSIFASAQSAVVTVTGQPFTPAYSWPAMTAAGVSSTSILTLGQDGAPSSFTIDEATTGTAPTTCTFEVESSPDGITFNSGSGSLSGSLDCHTVGLLTTSFISKPVRYIRINLLTFTGGDGTTRITFSYTRGQTR